MTKKQLMQEAEDLVDLSRRQLNLKAQALAIERELMLRPDRVRTFLDTLATCAYLDWVARKPRGRRAQLLAINKWRYCATTLAFNHLARRKDWKG